MEYVADELGVELLRLPVLQRELSLRADPAAILALRTIIRQRRPDVLHTHTAKAGATGRLAAVSVGARPAARDRPHLPRPRPQRLLQQALGARLPLDRARARAHVRDADRRQRRGARRPRRLRRRAGPPLRRRPVRLRPAAVERGGRRGAARDPRRDRRRRRHVRRRLGRAPDRDQAPARPRPHAARALGTTRSTRCSCSSATARTAPRWRRSPPSSASPTAAASSASRRASGPGTRRSTRSLLTSANEGTPVVAIEALAAARPVVATRAGGTGTVVRNGESGYLEAIGDTAALADRLATAGPRPRAAGADGRARRRGRARRASRSAGWPTRSRRSTAGCSR